MMMAWRWGGLAAAAVMMTAAGCDDGEVIGASGTVTLRVDQGVDLVSGQFQAVGNYRDSDLIARRSGSRISLVTGGSTPTSNRPINWFMGGGGVLQRFDNLAAVPKDAPGDSMTQPNLGAQMGHGFVVKTAKGSWTRGWVEAADSESATIVFEHLADPILPE